MNRQCPVPKYQRPLTEYNDLKDSFSFSWTQERSSLFNKNLLLFLVILIFLTSLLLKDSYGQEKDTFVSFLHIIESALGIFTLWILRLYLAWKYIYDRLMNATVSYEESGWYDGQTWVKTNEVLIQDRLIGSYEVLPIMDRLRTVILTSTLSILFITYLNIRH